MGNGLTVETVMGELTINGVSMHTPAWRVLDLIALWASPDLRGNNTVLPGSPGRHPYPKRNEETVYSLEMIITGAVDISGTPYANAIEGLQLNCDYLRAQVDSPPTLTTTRSATLDMPDGSTRTAEVQAHIEFGLHASEDLLAILHLTIPAGGFA